MHVHYIDWSVFRQLKMYFAFGNSYIFIFPQNISLIYYIIRNVTKYHMLLASSIVDWFPVRCFSCVLM
jgi:hypothetical protein